MNPAKLAKIAMLKKALAKRKGKKGSKKVKQSKMKEQAEY